MPVKPGDGSSRKSGSCASALKKLVDDGHLGEVGFGVVGDTKDEEGAVVVGLTTWAGVLVGGFYDALGNFEAGIGGGDSGEQLLQAINAVLFLFLVHGFVDAVGSEDDYIAGHKAKRNFVIFRFG